MTETKQRRFPGPDHPISVQRGGAPVTATFDGTVVAATSRALLLDEADYGTVYYFPREDVDPAFLTPSDHTTYCPYKGDCSYFTLHTEGRTEADVAWSYEQPYEAVAEIAGHIAFYPDKVDVTVMD